MRVWWSKPNKWRTRDSYRNLFHRLKENYSLLDKDDPDTRWRCCDLWPRLLSNKWNAREFAQRHGVRVPELYWYGRRLSALPVDDLPDHPAGSPLDTNTTFIMTADGSGTPVTVRQRTGYVE